MGTVGIQPVHRTAPAAGTPSPAWLVLVLALGLGCTAWLFWHLQQLERERLHLHLQRGVEALAGFASQPFLGAMYSELQGTFVRLQQQLNEEGQLSPQLLAAHLWQTPPAGLQATTLEYLSRVSGDGGNDSAAADVAVLQAGPQGLVPAAPRDEYFPVLLEASRDGPHAAPGLDRGSEPLSLLALQQARDSGEIAIFAEFPLAESGAQGQQTHYFMPVYQGDNRPSTVAERRQLLSGYFSAVSYNTTVDLYSFLSSNIQGISTARFRESALLEDEPAYAGIRQLLARREAARFDYLMNGTRMTVIGVGSPALRAALASPTRWWVLAGGFLLTAAACGLLLWVRRQSRQILALVEARTAELRESESRYRMLAEHASDVIFATDIAGNLNYVSPSVQAQRGFSVEELLGRHLSTQLPAALAHHVLERLVKLGAQKPPVASDDNSSFEDTFEYESQCRDGTALWLETTMSTLYDTDGRPAGVLGVSRDISERKQVESERSRLQDAYRQAQKMEAIGTLAGGVAHDFNNLLTAIFGYADMLRYQVQDNPAAEESIGVIENAATRARDLTSQLLGFARKGRYQALAVDINDTIQEVYSLLRRSLDRNIEIRLQAASAPATVTGDPGQLTHMLLNLGINARDAMPDGGTLTFAVQRMAIDERFCEKHPELHPGRYVMLSVTDTGTGIAQDQLIRIFEPFFTNKQHGKGSGLGLAMVYGVARSHGGLVTVESEAGKGAVFRVYLPYVAAEPGALAAEPTPSAMPVHGSGTILVIDDEPDIRTLAARMLELLGYRVLLAEDGRQGVELYTQQRDAIDLVIVDMIMPVMGGRECIETLKALDPGVRIIVASGYSREEAGAALPLSSILGFLQKPWRQQQLAQLLAEALAVRPAAGVETDAVQ